MRKVMRVKANDRDHLLKSIDIWLLTRQCRVESGLYRVTLERLDDGGDEMFNDDERAQLRCLG